MEPIRLQSFGYRHGPPPDGAEVIDTRHLPVDHATLAGLAHLNGRHARILRLVTGVPGVRAFITSLVNHALALPADQPRRIALGCETGRHVSPALVTTAHLHLRARGYRVVPLHRDIYTGRGER
ncbi:RapZ C-terminal domain-containing protein [Allokutzneria oryzae]|uniref:RapZ C-terminal domain-containing protein n=1 Tax=Allokutzneria oryzae TaxID=1378989 RepID=A0ABV6A943_9PSEU